MKALLFFLFLASTISQAATLKDRLKGPLVAAHRGGMVSISNNTLEQFEKARKEGASDIIEMDLRLTRDGIPVVYHDEKIDGSTGCKGEVSSYVFADLKKCPLSLSGHLIPSFEEVLRWNKGRLILNAEFKTFGTIKPAIDLVQKYAAHESVYFQANSSRDEYVAARTQDEDVALLFKPLSLEDLDWILDLNDPNLVIIELRDKTITPEFISRARAAGKLVSANAFQMSAVDELFGAACDLVYKKGLDIAVTNRPAGCARQKKYYKP